MPILYIHPHRLTYQFIVHLQVYTLYKSLNWVNRDKADHNHIKLSENFLTNFIVQYIFFSNVKKLVQFLTVLQVIIWLLKNVQNGNQDHIVINF